MQDEPPNFNDAWTRCSQGQNTTPYSDRSTEESGQSTPYGEKTQNSELSTRPGEESSRQNWDLTGTSLNSPPKCELPPTFDILLINDLETLNSEQSFSESIQERLVELKSNLSALEKELEDQLLYHEINLSKIEQWKRETRVSADSGTSASIDVKK